MNDVAAGRQHDIRIGAVILSDQFERAAFIGPVGEYPPYESAGDRRQVLAIVSAQRQHRLARSRSTGRRTDRRNRSDRGLRRWRLHGWRRRQAWHGGSGYGRLRQI